MLLVRYYLLLGIFVGVVVVPAVTRESNSPISTTTGSTTSSLSQDETSTSVTEETESSTDASTEASTSPSQNETSISEPKATESRANTTSSPSQNETSISVTKARESSTTTSKSTTTSSPSPNETPTSVTEVTESSTDTSTQSDTVTEPNGNNQSEATTYPSEVTSGTEISLNFTSEATLSEISTIDTISTSQINDLTTTREDIFEITEPTEKNNENGVSSITEIFTTTLSTTTSNAVTTTMSSTDTEYTTTSQSSNPAPITISDTVSTTPSIDFNTVTPPITTGTPSVITITLPITTITPPVTTETPPITTGTPSVTTITLPITTITPPVTTVTPATTTGTPPVITVTPLVTTVTPPITKVTPPITTGTPSVITITLPITTITPPVTTSTPPVTKVTPPITTGTPSVTTITLPITTITPPVTTVTPATTTGTPPVITVTPLVTTVTPPVTKVTPHITTVTPSVTTVTLPVTTILHNTTPHKLDNGTTITVNTTIVIPSSTTTASPDTTTLETSTNNTSTSVTTSTTVTTSTSPTTPTPPNLKIDLEITKINSTSFNVGWIVDNHYEKDNYSINITRNDSNKTCDSDDGTFAFDYRCCNYIYTKALPGFEYSIFIINSNQTKREMFASTTWIMPNQESALTCYKTDEITATTATIIMTKNTNLIDQPKYLKIIISNEDLIKEKYCLGNNDISNEYQSVKIDWSSLEDNFKVMLGENKACSEQATNCNRPLKPNQRYYVSFAFFYNNYYHIVSYKELSFITEKQSNLSLALGLTFGLIFVSAAGYFAVMLWRRGFLKKITLTWWHSTPDVHPDDDENRETLLCPRKAVIDDDGTSPKAVKVSEFVIHCEYLEENPEKQALQWEQLDAESKAFDVQYNTSFATLPENKRKNRYPNILPWDHCRVKLNIDEDDEICSDYINASYIKGASNKNEYIATQGPLAGTCRDFWKMVVQENVKIIVMVSKFIENNRDKCYKYFPKNHETMLVGEDIEVRCSTELHFGVYCVRTLQVRKDYTLVTVTHMQFLEWPDFGVPTGTENMLQFCHQLRNRWGNEGGLALVHCSAGVGRTGTLIATDILLQAIETESKISVYNTILEMRKQRKSMVQTQKQYMYIHQLIKSMLEDPIMPEPLNTEPVYENIIINVDQLKVEPIETAESAF